MRTTFTNAELDKIRTEFSRIERVSIDRLDDFHLILDSCQDVALVQLARGGIPFVSKLAVNACSRRGIAAH